MSFTDRDYTMLGKAIVKDYDDQGINLAESIAKIASDQSMNTEEIKRLVETTNTLAHLHLFDKMADGDDRYVTFEAADPEELIQGEKTAAVAPAPEPEDITDFYRSLPDERTHLTTEKLAALDPDLDVQAVLQETSPNDNPYSGTRGYTKIAQIRDCNEELRMRILSAYEDYREKVAELSAATQRTLPEDLRFFEKDAVAAYGEDCREALDELEQWTHGHFKHSREPFDQNRHHVFQHPLHAKLAAVMEARQEVLTLGKSRDYLHTVAGHVL